MTDKNFGFVHVDAGMGKSRIPFRKHFKLKRNVYFRLRKYQLIKTILLTEVDQKRIFFPAGRGKINDLLRELHGAELNGNKLRVQLSTSGVRQSPGMGGDECFK